MNCKRCLLVFFLCILLQGCGTRLGHFEDGSIDLDQLIVTINEKTKDKEWEFPILNQTAVDEKEIADVYAMDMTNVKHSYSVTSLIKAQLGEISFFQVDKNQDEHMNEVITTRIISLHEEWDQLILEANEVLAESKQGRIGEYYYVIVGRDAQKVVNYIQSIK